MEKTQLKKINSIYLISTLQTKLNIRDSGERIYSIIFENYNPHFFEVGVVSKDKLVNNYRSLIQVFNSFKNHNQQFFKACKIRSGFNGYLVNSIPSAFITALATAGATGTVAHSPILFAP